MKVEARKIGAVWRIVDEAGNPVPNRHGSAADGGGHHDEDKAKRQAERINSYYGESE